MIFIMETSNSALLAIDIQKWFMNEATDWMPSKLADFLDQTQFEHRIFTRFHNPGPGSFWVDQLGWYAMQTEEETAIPEELSQYPTLVTHRSTYSPFDTGDGTSIEDSELAVFLRDHQIDNVYICGVDTNVSVIAAAMDLTALKIEPHIITDLCGSHSGQELHETGLKIMEAHTVDDSTPANWHLLTTEEF